MQKQQRFHIISNRYNTNEKKNQQNIKLIQITTEWKLHIFFAHIPAWSPTLFKIELSKCRINHQSKSRVWNECFQPTSNKSREKWLAQQYWGSKWGMVAKNRNKYEINKTWIFKAKNWTTSNNDVEWDSRKVFGVKGY